jgi:hypothetical protein
VKLLRRKSTAPPDLASQCQWRHTRQGRIRHGHLPGAGALCPFGGAADIPADLSMQVCTWCADALAELQAAL